MAAQLSTDPVPAFLQAGQAKGSALAAVPAGDGLHPQALSQLRYSLGVGKGEGVVTWGTVGVMGEGTCAG